MVSKNLWKIESPHDVNKVTLPSKFDVAMGYQTLLDNLTASAPIALSGVYVTFYFRCLSSGHCQSCLLLASGRSAVAACLCGLRLSVAFDKYLSCLKLVTVNFILLSSKVNLFANHLILHLMLLFLVLLFFYYS